LRLIVASQLASAAMESRISDEAETEKGPEGQKPFPTKASDLLALLPKRG
jgi:hypothetical protein